jgi:hypothetical protein
MTLIYVKDEKRTIKSICAMIDKAPNMDVFRLEEIYLDGTKGTIIVLSKNLRGHPCLEEFNMTTITLIDATLSLDQVISMIMDSVPNLGQIKLEKVPVASSGLAAAGNRTSMKTPMDGPSCLDEFRIMSTTLADGSLSLDQVISRILDLVPELRHVEPETVPVSSSALAASAIVPKFGQNNKDAVEPDKADAQSPSIQWSDIMDNGVSDLRCGDFATAPDNNSSIQTVHLECGGEITCEQRTPEETTSPKRAGGKHQASNRTMTSVYVKGENMTIKSLCARIDNAPRMDIFKLEEVEPDGANGSIIVFSKALRGHPCLEEFNMTSVTLTDATLGLDQVVSTILDSVPDLKHIKLEKVPVSPSTLATAGNHTRLKTPSVPKRGLTDKDAAQSPSNQLTDIPLSGIVDHIASDLGPDKNFSIQTVHLEGVGEICSEQRTQVETTSPKRAGGNANAA